MKVKKLTDNTFLCINDLNVMVSLVFKRENVYVSTHNGEKVYNNFEEIAKEFAEKNVEFLVENKQIEKITDIKGYPIKHDQAFDIKQENDLITYRMIENGKVMYYAGFWAIETESTWRVSLSPKVTSVLNNKHEGPFKSKMEANFRCNKLNDLKEREA